MTVHVYNFARPPQLPGDGMARLGSWLEAALKLAIRSWARELPFSVAAEGSRVDVALPGEVFSAAPEHVLAYRVLIGERELPSLLLLPRPLMVALLGGLLGESVTDLPADRDLTPVEGSLAEYFLQSLWLPFFKDTWPGPMQLLWQLGGAETRLRAARTFKADEAVVVCAWKLRGPFGSQECHWLFRSAGLPELLGIATETPAAKGAGAAASIDAVVRVVPLDMTVILGSAELRLAQLSQLRPGDVILLGQRIGDPVTGYVDDKPLFRGWAGRVGPAKAFRIESMVAE